MEYAAGKGWKKDERKEADRVLDLKFKSKKGKKAKKSGCELPTRREREQEKEKSTGNNQIQFNG
jgi:hypothetical protein